jgi:transmembrane sensor
MESDPRNALAYRQISASWEAVGPHASAPEIMLGRRDALDDARGAAQNRWGSARSAADTRGGASSAPRKRARLALAASILIALVGGLTWLYSQRGVYTTGLGERRALTLQDGSVVTLDARSRIRVNYRDSVRLIALERGQARFDVARDATRPFRVRAGEQTVVALGTQFNVELVAGNVLVSMIEGHVAVTKDDVSGEASRQASTIELRAGEGLRVRADGQAIVAPKIDIDRATAWQSGKMVFDGESLSNAAERFNRYSRRRIEVDPSIASLGISGVFNAGDPDAFIEAVSLYFPVDVERRGASEIRLVARK